MVIMPVIDHAVSEMVKRDDSEPYSCSRDKGQLGYYAMVRRYHKDNGTYEYVMEYIPHRMSTLCRYDNRAGDPRCSTCVRESDADYLTSYGLQ